MSSRSATLLYASVEIAGLPATRRMPAPTPLPTLQGPSLAQRLAGWLGGVLRSKQPQRRPSAQVLRLRA